MSEGPGFRAKHVTIEKFLAGNADNSINRHMAEIANKVRARAQEKAPVAHPAEDAEPGKLRDSIKAIQDPQNFGSYLVGSNVDYAKYVEFGTAHEPARPFLRPALDEVKAEEGRNHK